MTSDTPTRGVATRDPIHRPGAAGDVRAPASMAGHLKPALRRVVSVATLIAIDLTSLVFAVLITLALKTALRGERIDQGNLWTAERHIVWIASLTLVLVFLQFGLYATRDHRPGSARILSAIFTTTLILLGLGLLTDGQFDTYFLFYASFFFMAVINLSLRASYESITALALDRAHFRRRAVLVGEQRLNEPIAAALTADLHPRRGVPYEIVAMLEPADGLHRPDASAGALALRAAIDPAVVDEVIITGGLAQADHLNDLLLLCRQRGIAVRLAPTTSELLSYTLRPSATPGVPLFELRPPVLSWLQFRVKRLFDLVVGGILIVIGAPIMGLAALLIRLEDRGPVLFHSERIGLNQAPFTCLKLRTMRVGAEDEQSNLERFNESGGPLFKIRVDPRITRTGRLLRRFSIDELPQLINVMRGEMSLVGPRPLPTRDFERMDEIGKRRYAVLPGLTGLWQVSGRADLTAEDLARFDAQYIETWSIWSDFVILARTLPVVLGRRGAY